jgi:hypothetical protein
MATPSTTEVSYCVVTQSIPLLRVRKWYTYQKNVDKKLKV